MDRRAWWAAVYGVAKSWTRLKRISSSSSPSERPFGRLLVWQHPERASERHSFPEWVGKSPRGLVEIRAVFFG